MRSAPAKVFESLALGILVKRQVGNLSYRHASTFVEKLEPEISFNVYIWPCISPTSRLPEKRWETQPFVHHDQDISGNTLRKNLAEPRNNRTTTPLM